MCGITCFISIGDFDLELLLGQLNLIVPRGPDRTNYSFYKLDNGMSVLMGFTRLAIMDTTDAGLQPFENNAETVICNGEIYNYKELAKKHNIDMKTDCDCEVILPIYKSSGFFNMIQSELNAEFAMVLFDRITNEIFVARDRYGVRPLYYGYDNDSGLIGFSSELKGLHNVCKYVNQLKPNQFIKMDLTNKKNNPSEMLEFTDYYNYDSLSEVKNIHTDKSYIEQIIKQLFTTAVAKRLYADRPIGFLLSGGLDSSLIVAIASKILDPNNMVCFSIGLPGSPDVIAAKKVVDFLGIKNHHIVPFSIDAGLTVLPEVIKTIETYDITTIRASTPQYLMAKYIRDNTDIKVLLSGEGSDEIHGSYRYFRDAPNPIAFHTETVRLLKELYMYDNKRTDRTMAGNGLEVRVPFLDFEYVEFIMRINPELLMYRTDWMEKKIIRDAFVGYLPDDILYRSKEAFSDAVSSNEVNWYRSIQEVANREISQTDIENSPYIINKPQTSEALYFRRIFDKYYPSRDNIITGYWLPRFQKNIVLDPSATVLKSYATILE